MIETNRFQILNPDILTIIYDYGKIYLYKLHTYAKRCSEVLFYLPAYYLKLPNSDYQTFLMYEKLQLFSIVIRYDGKK